MKKQDHPFYCYKKNCQKSVWNTPEYLDEDDWINLGVIIDFLEKNDIESFYDFVKTPDEAVKNFFYRVIAWPEGKIYCQDKKYFELSGFPGIKKHLKDFKKALTKHNKK